MYRTRDECLEALMKDKATLQKNETLDILCRPFTGAYYYTTYVRDRLVQSGEGESMEILYGRVGRTLLSNRWDFRPVSRDAKEDLEKNPLPTTLIIGSE
jgi:hypothetical protein